MSLDDSRYINKNWIIALLLTLLLGAGGFIMVGFSTYVAESRAQLQQARQDIAVSNSRMQRIEEQLRRIEAAVLPQPGAKP